MGSGKSPIGGGSAGGGGMKSWVPDGRRQLTIAEIKDAQKKIDKGVFIKNGNGVWDFAGPYTIGAQILDETDSAAGGFGMQKTYSMKTWGQAVGDMGTTTFYSTLNAAKSAAREEMKGWVPSVTVKN